MSQLFHNSKCKLTTLTRRRLDPVWEVGNCRPGRPRGAPEETRGIPWQRKFNCSQRQVIFFKRTVELIRGKHFCCVLVIPAFLRKLSSGKTRWIINRMEISIHNPGKKALELWITDTKTAKTGTYKKLFQRLKKN